MSSESGFYSARNVRVFLFLATFETNLYSFLSFFLSLIRLDVILGKVGSKAKDVYDSKQSLASRIVKVERTVSSID